jgi:hypothetical protein
MLHFVRTQEILKRDRFNLRIVHIVKTIFQISLSVCAIVLVESEVHSVSVTNFKPLFYHLQGNITGKVCRVFSLSFLHEDLQVFQGSLTLRLGPPAIDILKSISNFVYALPVTKDFE